MILLPVLQVSLTSDLNYLHQHVHVHVPTCQSIDTVKHIEYKVQCPFSPSLINCEKTRRLSLWSAEDNIELGPEIQKLYQNKIMYL